MISIRTRYSLAQFLELQEPTVSLVLLGKHGGEHLSLQHDKLLQGLLSLVRDLRPQTLMSVLSEVAATSGDLSTRVTPKYRFKERMQDLTQCLLLDGYVIQDKRLVQLDPSIHDGDPIEDDLIESLKICSLPHAADVVGEIKASEHAFRSAPPDYNASLVHARIALETLARDIAGAAAASTQVPAAYDPSKWGEILAYLRKCGEVSPEIEKGLAGVFGFVSPGAHRPVSIPEGQMTRLGRSLALSMCWFLLKNRIGAAS